MNKDNFVDTLTILFCFFAKDISSMSGCYQAAIVSLDCSSDIQQIKLKGEVLSPVTRSLEEKAPNAVHAHCINNALKVAEGLQSAWVSNSVHGIQTTNGSTKRLLQLFYFFFFFCLI